MNSKHWILERTVLRPTLEKMESLVGVILENISEDEKIAIRLPQNPNNAELITNFLVHKSVLCAASAPLKTMVTAPFSENRSRVINLDDEDAKYADALVKHLYCKPLDLASYDCGLAKSAHKWELTDLYEAYFLAFYKRPLDDIQMFRMCLPIMETLKIPDKLKYLFSKAFGQNFDLFEGTFWKRLKSDASSVEDSSATVPKDGDESSRKEVNEIIPDSAPAHWFMWDMFLFQGMLVDIFKNISMYSEIEAGRLLISVLINFEKGLSDSELEACLCHAGCHHLINCSTPEGLFAEHPRLTYAAVKVFCDPLQMTYPPLKVTRKFLMTMLKTKGQAQFTETRYYGNEKFKFELTFNWHNYIRGQDRGVAKVQISGDYSLPSLSLSQTYEMCCGTFPDLGVRASCTACTCVDHSKGRDYIGTSAGTEIYSNGNNGSSPGRTERFRIMTGSELLDFKRIHQNESCGLVFHLSFYPDFLKQKTWKN